MHIIVIVYMLVANIRSNMVANVIPLYLTLFLFVTVITYIYMKNKDGFR